MGEGAHHPRRADTGRRHPPEAFAAHGLSLAGREVVAEFERRHTVSEIYGEESLDDLVVEYFALVERLRNGRHWSIARP